MRATVLFNRLGPYHHARLKASAARCQLSCVEVSGIDQTYQWEKTEGSSGFRRVTLFADADAKLQPLVELQRRLWSALDELQPHVVAICGWSGREALSTLHWCHENAVPAIVMSESQAIDEDRSWWKETIKRRVVEQFSAGLVGGMPHTDYLHQLGMPREQIFTGYDAVDINYFEEASDRARRDGTALRTSLGLPQRYFLASNRFIEKKNIPRLLQAFSHYRCKAGNDPWKLVLLGDGELKPQILQLRQELGLEDDLLLPGFKQYDELPLYYGLAGAFIHASTVEQWGLVVNEAMASGLPVLVSNRCGCAPDLVQNGRNGFTFDPFDVDGLAELMLKLSSGECDLAAMGQASRDIIAGWGTDTFAVNLMKAADTALSTTLPKANFIDKAVLWGLIHK